VTFPGATTLLSATVVGCPELVGPELVERACGELVEPVEGFPAPIAAFSSAHPANPAAITASAITPKTLRLIAFAQAIPLKISPCRNR
jgi:hypothetical protein